MADNPRTDTARDHDDRDLIEGLDADTATPGSAGGQLARDLGSADDLVRDTDDPEGHRRVTKQAAIDHGQARPASRGPDRQ